MDKDEAVAWLNSLPDKAFVEFFYEHLSRRHLWPTEAEFMDCHFVLGAATRMVADDGHWGD